MTLLAEPEVAVREETAAPAGAPVATGQAPISPEPRLAFVVAAAVLSTSAAAWMATGMLKGGVVPRMLALVGVLIGCGLPAMSFRLSRPAVLQYAVLPVSLLGGAIAVAPYARGGTANLPGLVHEAVTSGGVLQPPIPFDPGWRVILVVLFALAGAASLLIPVALRRSRLAVVIPLPITVGASLVQPKGHELLTSSVAIFLVIGAVAVAYGADLQGEVTAGFEVRRLVRGVGLLLVVVVGLAGLAQANVLFPASNRDRVLPPQRPPATPLEKDRVIFLEQPAAIGPWRVGTLDVYDGRGWLLPPVDPHRVVHLEQGRVPDVPVAQDTEQITITVKDIRGRSLPVPAGMQSISGAPHDVVVDPRTGVPQLGARVPQGLRYTVTAAKLPTGSALNTAPDPPKAITDEFTAAPPPPPEVSALLLKAPSARFDRLQFVRDALYRNVVAAGAGQPVDVPPARVAQMLHPKTEATPYEITAAEALLARWAGVPARMGFGYHGGKAVAEGYELHPRDGAVWLEAYFQGHGWVPLVGVPPQARSSLSSDDKNKNPSVKQSDELALNVLIPIQEPSYTYLFEVLRYWLLVALPFVLGGLSAVWGYPAALKLLRRRRRRRWGDQHGPLGRVLVSYAEFRDLCWDLNLADPGDTPLRFVTAFTDDAEHEELAWLVTRLAWGDLRRDPLDSDVDACRELTRSVTRRLLAEQSAVNRALAWTSRASLRSPWSVEVPNLWPQVPVGRIFRGVAAVPRRVLRRSTSWRPAHAHSVVLVVMCLLLSACGVRQGGLDGARQPVAYPNLEAPSPGVAVDGVTLRREPKAEAKYALAGSRALVTQGHVYTIREGTVIQGSLQIALFRPDLDGSDGNVRGLVLKGTGGAFQLVRFGTVQLWVRVTAEQLLYVWFPPDRNVMVSFTMRRSFARAPEVVRALVAFQRHIDPELVLHAVAVPTAGPDPSSTPSTDAQEFSP